MVRLLIDDWIVWLPTFKGFWTPKNIKEVHAYGVELKAGLDWQLNADGNFSWTPSINNGDPVDWYDKAIGKQLVYIPEYSASVTGRLTYRSGGSFTSGVITANASPRRTTA